MFLRRLADVPNAQQKSSRDSAMTDLQSILDSYRTASATEREKGSYFEELCRAYFRYEASYADLYSDVWLYADWAKENGYDGKDTGIDLVAKTRGTEEYHAIQAKFYAEDRKIEKKDIDSFFTASGQEPFSHRLIVTTTNEWTDNAEKALYGQQIPVSRIDLLDLENSQIDWSKYAPNEEPELKPKYDPRPHQQTAITKVKLGLVDADRGKLIMACGTGKTYTSLKIAEEMAGKGGRVLFLVPSLSLLSQTLTEWTQQSKTPLHSFAVCSDSEVGKKRKRKEEDHVQTFAHELRYPATTDSGSLAREVASRHDSDHMSVVFSTYHSLQVVSEAQQIHKLADFDLIVCDEAHRTTGATFEDEAESTFVKVHDADFLKGAKRLYMTATPRIYADMAKAKAITDNTTLASMDDEALYGKQLHVITFSEAVELKLLTDYKVIVLTIDQAHVSERLQNLLKDDNNQLKVDDAARIIGCWKALGKQEIAEELDPENSDPMKKAVAFCQVIEPGTGSSRGGHKVSSKQIASMFQAVIDEYQSNLEENDEFHPLKCESQHVDGSMNAAEKEEKLEWLKAETDDPNVCRILSNVRCLSEGVDVPALDAVLFLTPRNSQVDVVQSVGRVMRNAPGKKRGYVILPVVIPAGMEPHAALDDNKIYKVVWEVLQALRSHDDQFDAMINKLEFTGRDPGKMEVVAVTDKISKKSTTTLTTKEGAKKQAAGGETIGKPEEGPSGPGMKQTEFQFDVGELEKALYAKVVKKCGNRYYWDDWAKDIAEIAQTHITRIRTIVGDANNKTEAKAFHEFADELRDDLNDEITDEEVIEMLAQHLITKPVFDALFNDYSFASNNPVSQAMQDVLDILQEHRLDKEADTLDKFYRSVEMRASGIEDAGGKQKIVVELYDKFFRNAFPKMTDRLGIVYTPVEVVDFIINSINDLLRSEFGQTLGSDGVHIIDPFTGTGTFVTRLMQSGLIRSDQLEAKYRNEIHANELVLLAYYIAAINIEAVYHGIAGGEYAPFEGICLTDTFQMFEKEDLISNLLDDNSDRRKRQKDLDIRVIMANPPYSGGQTSANDNNQNVSYPDLDKRIANTYGAESRSTTVKGLANSYIRAIRWASDRVGESGVVGFVVSAGFLEDNTTDGMRKCLQDEFDSIYVFHLRGNQRTSGELSRKEGGKIFDSGSRAPIAIVLFVKKPSAQATLFDQESGKGEHRASIFWHDVGDYLSKNEKLRIVRDFGSVDGIGEAQGWTKIVPDKHNDWINQRDESFENFLPIGDKKAAGVLPPIFRDYSLGLNSNRDAWVYSSSRSQLENQIEETISTYNEFLGRGVKLEDIERDEKKLKWSSSLESFYKRGIPGKFRPNIIEAAAYRPFFKTWLYREKLLNHRPGKWSSILPKEGFNNITICVTGKGSKKPFSCLVTDKVTDLELISKGQCFPLYLYDHFTSNGESLFDQELPESFGEIEGRSAIDGGALNFFRDAYGGDGKGITAEDLFYYVYGLLHSPEYRNRYADNLSKELPRIPAVKSFDHFVAFSKAGRDLARWHLDYETVELNDDATIELTGSGASSALIASDYRVTKMKFGKVKDPKSGKRVDDKSTVIYNDKITILNVPLEAYDYVVNGKPALEWVMERQAVTTDTKSGIVNDANFWATETMNDAKYPLELFLRMITVSLETNNIVSLLPKLVID